MSTFAGSGGPWPHAAWPLQATMKCVDTVKDGTCSENDETPMFRNPSLWTPWVCLALVELDRLQQDDCWTAVGEQPWANKHGQSSIDLRIRKGPKTTALRRVRFDPGLTSDLGHALIISAAGQRGSSKCPDFVISVTWQSAGQAQRPFGKNRPE